MLDIDYAAVAERLILAAVLGGGAVGRADVVVGVAGGQQIRKKRRHRSG